MSTTKVTDAVRDTTAVDASKLTGSIANARIPEAAVTQHVTAFDPAQLEMNMAILAFKVASANQLAKFSMVDQVIDEYQDATGIDAGASTNELAGGATTSKYYEGGSVVTPTITHDADATGTDGDYSWYKWTDTGATGSYSSNAAQTVDFLVIAGGGGGGGQGANGGGGGGAGGYRNSYASETSGGGGSTESDLSLGSGVTYTITVGAGGAVGTTGADGATSSISGSDITDITTVGGGGGGPASGAGRTGGSGGGKGRDGGTSGAAAGTANQGFAGGVAGGSTASSGGGGGGAGAVGYNGHNPDGSGDPFTAGDTYSGGGVGLSSSIDGTATFRAGGGGGSYEKSDGNADNQRPQGGNGGGGHGAGQYGNTLPATAGAANTGSGGGGGQNAQAAGAGGSGIVIIRRLTTATAIANLTLQSVATTAESAPTTADLVVLIEDSAGTATVNTDIKGYVSRNGSAFSSAVTFVDEGDWGTNKRILVARNIDISGITTGTAMKYKLTTHNQSASSKETRIHATSLAWA